MTRRYLVVANPIVNEDNTMSDQMRQWVRLMSDLQPHNGNGSPEGVVEAMQYSTYYDDTGSVGSIAYVKMLPDIAGDKSKGWVAV